MKNTKEMNGNELIAYKNIKGIFDWNVGGWYNDAIQDGNPEYVPATIEEAKELIYEDAMNNYARPGFYSSGNAPKEMRFAGKEFAMEVIDHLFENDDDITEIGIEKGWFTVKEDLTEAMRCEQNEDELASTKKEELNTLIEELSLHFQGEDSNIKVIDKAGRLTYEGPRGYLFEHRCKTLLYTRVKDYSEQTYYLNRKYLPIKVKESKKS